MKEQDKEAHNENTKHETEEQKNTELTNNNHIEKLDNNVTLRKKQPSKSISPKKQNIDKPIYMKPKLKSTNEIDREMIINWFKLNEEWKKWIIWGNEFKSQHKLEKHIVDDHFIPPIFICETCNSPYFRKRAYYYHVRNHRKDDKIDNSIVNQLPILSDINFIQKNSSQVKSTELGPKIKKREKNIELYGVY